jgi:hypothetical protein
MKTLTASVNIAETGVEFPRVGDFEMGDGLPIFPDSARQSGGSHRSEDQKDETKNSNHARRFSCVTWTL